MYCKSVLINKLLYLKKKKKKKKKKDGPEEMCPSGRTIGQMVRWYHPGRDPDLLQRVAIALTVRKVQPWVHFPVTSIYSGHKLFLETGVFATCGLRKLSQCNSELSYKRVLLLLYRLYCRCCLSDELSSQTGKHLWKQRVHDKM